MLCINLNSNVIIMFNNNLLEHYKYANEFNLKPINIIMKCPKKYIMQDKTFILFFKLTVSNNDI